MGGFCGAGGLATLLADWGFREWGGGGRLVTTPTHEHPLSRLQLSQLKALELSVLLQACGHRFCRGCMEGYLVSKVDTGSVERVVCFWQDPDAPPGGASADCNEGHCIVHLY